MLLIHNEKRVPGIFFPKIAKMEKPDINMEKHNPDTTTCQQNIFVLLENQNFYILKAC